MKYLLDTHAAVWLLEGSDKLGAKAMRALENETRETVAIADISLLEIAMLSARGVIMLSPDANRGLAAFAQQLTVLPISADVAHRAAASELPQRDPFDRVIVATALAHNLTLITKDRDILAAKVVTTLW